MKTPMIKSALVLAACATCAPLASVSAQTAPKPPEVKAATNVSDQEVDKFADTVIALNAIQKDASLEQAAKQKKMLAALQSHGLKPQRFNAIAKAAQGDDTLKQRVQTAVKAKAPAPAPAK